jgi:hypothetical protein
MAEKVTLKLGATAAAYAGKDAPREKKLEAAQGEVPLPEMDLVTLLYLLAHDPDGEVKGAAITTLRGMNEEAVTAVAENPSAQPRILDMLARLHFRNGRIASMLLSHPSIDEKTVSFLREMGIEQVADFEPPAEEAGVEGHVDKEEFEEDGEVDEESEEFKSKYQLTMRMEIAEKIKTALTGDKEWRTLLIRDGNKLVSSSVLKNPRITEGEVLAIAQSSVQNDEVMRLICSNKDWLKIYQIRKALVYNCKTPLQNALRLMMTLTDKDLSNLAKSKNVSSVISTQARRLLFNRQHKGQ